MPFPTAQSKGDTITFPTASTQTPPVIHQCLRGRRAQYISQAPAISSTAASASGAAGLAPVPASAPDAGDWLCRATGTKVSTAGERLSLADRNDCDVLGAAEVEGGGVEVGTVELAGEEDSAGEELDADELGAGELWLGDGQLEVGKN